MLIDIPIIWEYLNIFPEHLLGLPPKQELEVTLEVFPSIMPISETPYRIALMELA